MNKPISRIRIPGLITLLLLLMLVLVLFVGHVAAHPANSSGGSYDLSWAAVAGGGSTTASTGGSYSLSGTIGQPAAGTSTGGAYDLLSGFWAVTCHYYKLFLPMIMR